MRHRHLVPLVAILAVACGGGPSAPGSSAPPFAITHNPFHRVVGDTQSFTTYAAAGGTAATWALSGPAVFVHDGGTGTTITVPTPTAHLVGTGPGVVHVAATQAGSGLVGTASYHVVDPVTLTDMAIMVGGPTTVMLGRELYPQAFGWSGTVGPIVLPASWAQSDSSVLRLETAPVRRYVAVGLGEGEMLATYAGLHRAVKILVAP